MKESKDLLGSYIYLNYQLHKVTDYNIEYLVYGQKVVGFSSHSQNSEDIIGMSLHTSCRSKVGLVVFISYRGNSLQDFEKHLKRHLEYVHQNQLNEKKGSIHAFSTDFPHGEVLKMCFDIGLVLCPRFTGAVLALRNLEIHKIITRPAEKACF